MLTNRTSALTRTAAPAAAAAERSAWLLTQRETIDSCETGLSYRIERLLGEGGFGQVYLAARLRPSAAVPETLCIKVSSRIDGWLREAYFGQLRRQPSAGNSRVRCLPPRSP